MNRYNARWFLAGALVDESFQTYKLTALLLDIHIGGESRRRGKPHRNSVCILQLTIATFAFLKLASSYFNMLVKTACFDCRARMTHMSVPASERIELGIDDRLVRVSVGLEDAEDLVEDLTRGLNRVANAMNPWPLRVR